MEKITVQSFIRNNPNHSYSVREKEILMRHYSNQVFKLVDEDDHALCNSCETSFKPTIILATKDCPSCGEHDSLFYQEVKND